MTEIQTRVDELIQALKGRDYRLTPQRIELIRLIAESKGHPSAADLFDNIRSKFPTMSRATVYKTLALLKEMHQVLEIGLREDSRYDGNCPHPHPHLVCTRCGRILDGFYEIEPSAIQDLEISSGFLINSTQINFFGLCSTCRNTP